MARISLGPATGAVAGAQDSKRLVGATPQASSATALAGRSINQPALQPKAAPVNTYFQPGAPTLGGPVKIPAPPALPEPNQDLAALAKSLGGISQTLGTWGDTAMTVQKQRIADADAAGKAAAFSFTQQYPGQDFAALRDSLYKKAQGGDAQAAAMHRQMQALSPLQLAYANRYVAMANLRMDLDAAGDKWKQMTEVPGAGGGMVPKEYLQPNDPRAIAAMQSLLRIPNDPVVWKEFEPLVYAKYTQLSSAQAEVHSKWKEREWIASSNRAAAAALQSPNMTVEQKAAFVSQTLNDARLVLGVDGYQKVVENVMPQLRATAQLISTTSDNGVLRTDTTTASQLNQQVSEMQRLIVAGPNGERLIDYMAAKGGAVGVVENLRKSMEDAASLRNSLDAVQEATGEDIGREYIAKYGLNDPALAADRQAYDTAVLQATQAMANDPRLAGNVVALDKAQKAVQNYASTSTSLGSTRVQGLFAENAASIVGRDDLTGEQKVAALNRLIASGADATTVQGAMKLAQEQRRRDGAPQASANKSMVDRIVKQRETFLKRPGIGGVGLTNEEASEALQLRADLQRNLAQLEANLKAEGKSDAEVAVAQKEYLDKYIGSDAQAQTLRAADALPPQVTNPGEFYQKYNGLFKAVPTQLKQQLNQAVKSGKVVPLQVHDTELKRIMSGQELSPQMQFIIKQSGYGNKVGEFFRLQQEQHQPGVKLDPAIIEGFNRADALKISQNAATYNYGGFAMINPVRAQQQLVALSTAVLSRPKPVTTAPQVAAVSSPAAVTARIGSYAVPVSGVGDTGRGYGVPGQNDEQGRPVVLSLGAMNSFMQMVRDSKGKVRSADITSSQRSTSKNASVGGVSGSPHLSGRAVDIHGDSRKWMIANGAKYGWYLVDYKNSHGGHFEYRGA